VWIHELPRGVEYRVNNPNSTNKLDRCKNGRLIDERGQWVSEAMFCKQQSRKSMLRCDVECRPRPSGPFYLPLLSGLPATSVLQSRWLYLQQILQYIWSSLGDRFQVSSKGQALLTIV